tara:strand:- start:186 stop:572 length:387 start_codon:yes stop_codon:yes gene_type:complete
MRLVPAIALDNELWRYMCFKPISPVEVWSVSRMSQVHMTVNKCLKQLNEGSIPNLLEQERDKIKKVIKSMTYLTLFEDKSMKYLITPLFRNLSERDRQLVEETVDERDLLPFFNSNNAFGKSIIGIDR